MAIHNTTQRADHLMAQVLDHCQMHIDVCETMQRSSEELDSVKKDLANVSRLAGNLMDTLQSLERLIEESAIDIEQQEFENWKRREEELLNKEIDQKKQVPKAYEEHNQMETKKRVELYNVTFQAELEDYRRRRETEVSSLYAISKTKSKPSVVSTLESLQLDDDSQDLDNFLRDNHENKPSTSQGTHSRRIAKPESDKFYSSDEEDTKDLERLDRVRRSSISDEDGNIEILGDEDYEDI
ncbi:hypothetical protein EC973_002476 [Apophysomyces ossiformis]|uniref:Uncharacterized protein n=1 Tax=Apophysomyces ossiformis TaxID=679940 RepID=A0A8H7BI91_9FUNG|nr:hypothetical protein EC973_002476 [Apophysomyces ossiformis]